MKIVFYVVLIFSLSSVSGPMAWAKTKKNSIPLKADAEWVRKELTKMGFSKSFINESLKYYEPKSFEKTLTLNLLGFLRPPGQHMNLVTPQSVKASVKFINKNKKAFEVAKSRYKVPADVIAALLWIETRHGDDTGTFHTVSVYLHLMQADRAKNRNTLTKLALEKNKEHRAYKTKELKKLMVERTKKKSDWAREQIIALAAIRKGKHLDLKPLRGSYAGAFGLPQFIPSSYRAYAKALKPKDVPNLNRADDAIVSVAHYLSKHGWRSKKSSTKVKALMKYNNSRDYADSILAISKKIVSAKQPIKNRSLSSAEVEAP